MLGIAGAALLDGFTPGAGNRFGITAAAISPALTGSCTGRSSIGGPRGASRVLTRGDGRRGAGKQTRGASSAANLLFRRILG